MGARRPARAATITAMTANNPGAAAHAAGSVFSAKYVAQPPPKATGAQRNQRSACAAASARSRAHVPCLAAPPPW